MNYIELMSKKGTLEALSNKSMKASESVKLAKLIKKYNEEIEIFNGLRSKLIDKYKVTSDGDELKVNEGDTDEFVKELSDLLNTEVEDAPEEIVITSDIDVSAQQIIELEGLISFDEG